MRENIPTRPLEGRVPVRSTSGMATLIVLIRWPLSVAYCAKAVVTVLRHQPDQTRVQGDSAQPLHPLLVLPVRILRVLQIPQWTTAHHLRENSEVVRRWRRGGPTRASMRPTGRS